MKSSRPQTTPLLLRERVASDDVVLTIFTRKSHMKVGKVPVHHYYCFCYCNTFYTNRKLSDLIIHH